MKLLEVDALVPHSWRRHYTGGHSGQPTLTAAMVKLLLPRMKLTTSQFKLICKHRPIPILLSVASTPSPMFSVKSGTFVMTYAVQGAQQKFTRRTIRNIHSHALPQHRTYITYHRIVLTAIPR